MSLDVHANDGISNSIDGVDDSHPFTEEVPLTLFVGVKERP
jgi:hypothetical protein